MTTKKLKKYSQYCTGCGLCHSVSSCDFFKNENGFSYPKLSEKDVEFCNQICPAGEHNAKEQFAALGNGTWGEYWSVTLGWSKDKEIRKRASSGGILTGICIYLLENHLVDGIIHICAGNIPIDTKTVISRSKEEIVQRCGSRYSISSPLFELEKMLRKGEKYALVGKPCDVSALRMYMKVKKELKESIPYLFSFFAQESQAKMLT